jgi:hypothetical protein
MKVPILDTPHETEPASDPNDAPVSGETRGR